MIRILAKDDDATMAANIGGSVLSTYRTFDVDLPEVEAWLISRQGNAYAQAQIIGWELLAATRVAEKGK